MTDALERIHRTLVSGKGSEAREALLALAERSPKRKDFARLAQLAWRLGVPELGARLLSSAVKNELGELSEATDEERAEYAHCLVKLGAIDEGERILAALDPKKTPVALMYLVSPLVSRWDYAASIPLLNRYLAGTHLTPYARAVGQVNLAAALIYTRQSRKATPLVRQLLYTCSLRRYYFLLGRALELAAEDLIVRKKWDEADVFLDEARRRLAATKHLDAFFVEKFQVMIAVWRSGGSGASLEALRAFRERARELRHWETVRDCDRALSIAEHDDAAARYVYFGTPFEEFRTRFIGDYGALSDRDTFDWRLGEGKAKARVLDLLSGKIAGHEPLISGTLPHRLIVALSEDFYRPLRLGSLFARLYPEQAFNPETSPAVVYNALHRARQWAEGLPLAIAEERGFFFLTASAPFIVRVSRAATVGNRHADCLEAMKRLWPSEGFSIGDAQKRLHLPRRTLARVLQRAHEDGLLERTGSSRATRYAFAGK